MSKGSHQRSMAISQEEFHRRLMKAFAKSFKMKGHTYFHWWGFSINEGGKYNIHITYWPFKDFLFYLYLGDFRIVFGSGDQDVS